MQAAGEHVPWSGSTRVAAPRVALADVLSRSTTAWLLVGSLTVAGLVLRLIVADQALFADELSTFWIVTDHRLFDMFSVVHGNAEITPPLFFVLSWVTAHVSHSEELIRAPSLAAGAATIPLVYLLGLRTVGRTAALVATAFTAFSPFAIYYAAEARAYAVMMMFVVISTLALLLALERRGAGWWVVYALASCLAMYSHYTCVFLLAVQFAWVLWTQPGARRPAVLANLGAALLFAPWASGARNDLTSPTAEILSVISPFTVDSVTTSLLHWAIGHPYSYVPLDGLPGVPALAVGAACLVVAVAGCGSALIRSRGRTGGVAWGERELRLALVVALAASVPAGTMLASAVGDNIFGVRNLAASWPALALAIAALVTAAGPRLRYLSTGLTVLAVVIAGMTMLSDDYARPDHKATAEYIERRIAPGDVVIDATALISPGPLSTIDTTLDPGIPIVRAGAPAQRERPFSVFDHLVSNEEAFAQAVRTAPGKRVFYVSTEPPESPGYERRLRALEGTGSSFGYRRVSRRTFPGINEAQVDIFQP